MIFFIIDSVVSFVTGFIVTAVTVAVKSLRWHISIVPHQRIAKHRDRYDPTFIVLSVRPRSSFEYNRGVKAELTDADVGSSSVAQPGL